MMFIKVDDCSSTTQTLRQTHPNLTGTALLAVVLCNGKYILSHVT